MTKQLLIGAHTSIAGGLFNALYEGKKIGATAIQIFTANQRRWSSKAITTEDIDKWEEAKAKTSITHIMSHNSYLINMGSQDPLISHKSNKAFSEEIDRCHQLNIKHLNIHPGSATGNISPEECLSTIVNNILSHSDSLNNADITLILETTAGQGNNVGYLFDHMAYIISHLKGEIKVGVCIDTCHIFTAGYDIRTSDAWDTTLQQFDDSIGIKYLSCFHVNDSLSDIGEKKDRHAHLGKGKIGLESFKILMTNPLTRNQPKYLETPKSDNIWSDEISLLRKLGEK
jgi:deoxyribonuclease IV